jgi:guanylate kinase
MGEIARRGLMLVLSSPSGAGKTTISRALLEREPGRMTMSVSVTTRPARRGEVDGHDYHFIDRPKFDALVAKDELLEHAHVFGHWYGTPRQPVEKALREGRDVIFDIDWQGTQQLRQHARSDMASIFVLPPSMGELERRLRQRAQDAEAVVRSRMAKAAEEISHWAEYDYIIVNDELEDSIRRVREILSVERLRRERQIGLADFIRGLTAKMR